MASPAPVPVVASDPVQIRVCAGHKPDNLDDKTVLEITADVKKVDQLREKLIEHGVMHRGDAFLVPPDQAVLSRHLEAKMNWEKLHAEKDELISIGILIRPPNKAENLPVPPSSNRSQRVGAKAWRREASS